MLSVTVTIADIAFIIPWYGVYAIIALFTFLLHFELLKLMRNVLSEGMFTTASSYKKTIFAVSVILFAVIPLVVSSVLHQPYFYGSIISMLCMLTLFRAYMFEQKI